MSEQTYGGYTLQQLRDKWRFCPAEYEVAISNERAEQGLDFCEVACIALPDLIAEVERLQVEVASAARLATQAERMRLWLAEHEMNRVQLQYKNGTWTLRASGMISPKHLGPIASAEGTTLTDALVALGVAVEGEK